MLITIVAIINVHAPDFLTYIGGAHSSVNCRRVFFLRAHQQVDGRQQDRRGDRRPRRKRFALQGDKAELVGDEGHRIGITGLVSYREAGPLRTVHLALDRSHCREAGGAEKVEEHEGVSRERCVVSRELLPDLFALFRYFGKAEEDSEGADDVFLSDKPSKGGDGGLPGAPAERREYPGYRTPDSGEEAVREVFYHHDAAVGVAET